MYDTCLGISSEEITLTQVKRHMFCLLFYRLPSVMKKYNQNMRLYNTGHCRYVLTKKGARKGLKRNKTFNYHCHVCATAKQVNK